ADRDGAASDMLLHIVDRAEQALLLAFPQDEADGALRPDAELPQDPRGLHDRYAARAIVRRAVAGDPAVEMRSGHHVAGLGVGAGNIGDDVVGMRVVVEEPRVDPNLEHGRSSGPGETR